MTETSSPEEIRLSKLLEISRSRLSGEQAMVDGLTVALDTAATNLRTASGQLAAMEKQIELLENTNAELLANQKKPKKSKSNGGDAQPLAN